MDLVTDRREPRRASVVALTLAITFFCIPLFPAFITLTGAPVPGISLLPRALTFALLAVVVLAVASWTMLLLTSERRPIPTLTALAALPAAGLVSALLGFDALAGALFIAILLFGVILHATIVRFFRAPGVAPAIFWAYITSGALASLAAIIMVLAKEPSALYTIGHGRAIGTFVLPGELAGYLIVYVPIAFALARAHTDRRLRAVATCGLIVASIAFVLTFSRAGWFGMAAALAGFALMRRRRKGAAYAVAIVVAAALIVALIFNAHHDPSENFTRLTIWQSALEMVVRFPLTGVGPFQFSHLYAYVRPPESEPTAFHAHSLALTIAAETGLVGIAALTLGWWRFVVTLRATLHTPSAWSRISVAIAAGLFGTWVQGLIDTVTVVIFGLWLPMMALAIACANGDDAAVLPLAPKRPRAATITLCAVVVAIVAVTAYVQVASTAVFATAGAPISLAAHLSPELGARMFARIERVAPFPFVETMLADAAEGRHDLTAASRYAARIPPGSVRSERQARIALAQGNIREATARFVDAGDDEALQSLTARLVRQGHLRDAAELERRDRDRLAATRTRPNALAESWWRSARLAAQLHDRAEAARDDDRAIALAPLNTKFLVDAGTLALQRRDTLSAATRFARALDVDPADAGAIAGLGIVDLRRGDFAQARRHLTQATAIDARAPLVLTLRHALESSS